MHLLSRNAFDLSQPQQGCSWVQRVTYGSFCSNWHKHWGFNRTMGHSQSSRSGTKTFSVDFKSQSRTTAVVHHSAIDGIEHSVSTYSIPMCPRRHVLEIILYRPEIPQNTGNIGRLCAFIGNCRLHLIHPLGFTISEKGTYIIHSPVFVFKKY